MRLPTRPLGSSGLEITTVGFGAWAAGRGWFGGHGSQGDAACIAAMRHAIDLGVNWIDTAAVYGLEHSEEVVGRFLRELPKDSRPYIFTTCSRMGHFNSGMVEPGCLLTPDAIRENCEASLLRLGIQQIDLYQFHWPDYTGIPVEDLWAAMMKLLRQGKVRAVGVSNFPVEILKRCEEIGHVDSLQPPYSLMNREALANEVPWCGNRRTGVICWLPAHDWRRDATGLTPPELGRNPSMLEKALQVIARRHNTTVSCVMIAWTLVWPGVTAAIVGSRYSQGVDDWIGAGSLDLTQTDLEEIFSAMDRTNAGKGPSNPAMRRLSV